MCMQLIFLRVLSVCQHSMTPSLLRHVSFLQLLYLFITSLHLQWYEILEQDTTDNDKSIKCRTFRPEGLCQLRTHTHLPQLVNILGGCGMASPLSQPLWIEPWILLKLSECWVKLWPPEAINPSWMILIVLPMYRYVPHPNTAHSNTLQKYFSTYNVV